MSVLLENLPFSGIASLAFPINMKIYIHPPLNSASSFLLWVRRHVVRYIISPVVWWVYLFFKMAYEFTTVTIILSYIKKIIQTEIVTRSEEFVLIHKALINSITTFHTSNLRGLDKRESSGLALFFIHLSWIKTVTDFVFFSSVATDGELYIETAFAYTVN